MTSRACAKAILIVEDDPEDAVRLVRAWYDTARHDTLIVCQTGECAMDMLDRVTFARVIVDLSLPGSVQGMAVLDRARDALIPERIALTGSGHDVVLRAARDHGATRVVVKPVSAPREVMFGG